MQTHQNKAEADEQRRRRAYNETTRVGIALGVTPEQVAARREASEAEWVDWLNHALSQYKADEPQQILPQVLARMEERAALIGRESGKLVAEQIFQERIRKALK
jgi:hypothetical protein